MKFLSKDNFQLLVKVLRHNRELSSQDQGNLYHIMNFVNNQPITNIKDKNKTVIKLFYSQNKKHNPLEHLPLPNEITKSYFVPLNQQRNTSDIQIDNDTSTQEFKIIYDDSLNFIDKINALPNENRNEGIEIPETLEMKLLKQKLWSSIYDSIYLCMDSRDRNFTNDSSSHRMHIDLDKTIKQINSIELISAEIPKIRYLIHENNNILHFQETNGITLEATIPVGNYTISELITEVQTQLNSVGASNYTTSLINNRVRIASDLTGGGNIFSLLFDGGTENYGFKTRTIYKTNSIGDILGFIIEDKTGAGNYTASEKYKLEGDSNVYLHFTNIDCQKRYDQGAFAVIPMEVNHGETMYFQQDFEIKHVFSPLVEIHHLDVELRDYNGNYYQFNSEWSFTLKINYLK
jgi:hypothetical protein